MVTRLSRYPKDPNGLGRGPGYYYLRGGKTEGSFTLPSGITVKGAYYSKYSKSRDAARMSDGYKIDKVGKPMKLASKYAHVSDGNLRSKIRR